jgi:hypothetical protein
MATKKLAAGDAPEMVTLHSKNLGKTKDFTPAHAKNLLELQEAKGIKNGWAEGALPAEPATDNA